ncbi:MAG: SHOCT domain-containing protein [Desulfobacterales bacterium]|nr:SHOCT domain-containing protein [Desulfobacterales bacterium]
MRKEGGELFRGILLAHLVLFLHLLFIIGLGIVIIFFRGVAQYMLWIFLGLTAVLIASGFFCYHFIKTKGRQTLKDIEESAVFKNKNVEVRFLGGVASLKLNQPGSALAIENKSAEISNPRHQLEDPGTLQIRELERLADMLEKDLITRDEFIIAKKKLLKS